MTTTLDSQDPLGVAVTQAIRQGDIPALRRLLAEHPGLASAKIAETVRPDCSGIRTLLHIATDWPGHFPNGPQVLAALGRRAMTTSPPSTPLSRPARTSRRRAR
ncbi:hypothetical protein [Streptomyces sp. NPDC048425]|uniref:hypothetical protein n=1 Tax=Streptomyces sp. NPDC048425 TaxID=3365548 RepID=UPI00371A1A93